MYQTDICKSFRLKPIGRKPHDRGSLITAPPQKPEFQLYTNSKLPQIDATAVLSALQRIAVISGPALRLAVESAQSGPPIAQQSAFQPGCRPVVSACVKNNPCLAHHSGVHFAHGWRRLWVLTSVGGPRLANRRRTIGARGSSRIASFWRRCASFIKSGRFRTYDERPGVDSDG